MQLAAVSKQIQGLPTESHTGWFVGLGIGFGIVAVVVVLVAAILTYAARIGDQARDGIERMDDARASTLPIWNLQQLNSSATGIWRSAESVRHILGDRQ
ncbi:MAG: hypothetical protein ACR2NB_04605 [Solirubrobacteraceae bacterium]